MRFAVTAILLIAAICASALDVRSRFVSDQYVLSHGTTDEIFTTVSGLVVVQHVTNLGPSVPRLPGYSHSRAIQESFLTSDPRIKYTNALGHSFSKATIQGITARIWIFPLWQLTAFAGPLPLYRLYRWFTRPPTPGVCPACGYDLRATPAQCPECGLAPSPVSK